jgi:hypothetical protein
MKATARMNEELDAAGVIDANKREAANVRACRLAGAISRMSAIYQQGLFTLQRKRTGGNQIKVVSRGSPSRVFTFPLRDRYLPPCLCTMSCTEAAYAGTHPSSVTLMSAITYTVIVFISCSRSKKNPVGWTPNLDPMAPYGTLPDITDSLDRGTKEAAILPDPWALVARF